jgi:hypothetical protein
MDEIGDRRMRRSESPSQFSATAAKFLRKQETLDELLSALDWWVGE